MKRYLGSFYQAIHSPDDGGYYAEVFTKNGITLHSTSIYDSEALAVQAARKWLEWRCS